MKLSTQDFSITSDDFKLIDWNEEEKNKIEEAKKLFPFEGYDLHYQLSKFLFYSNSFIESERHSPTRNKIKNRLETLKKRINKIPKHVSNITSALNEFNELSNILGIPQKKITRLLMKEGKFDEATLALINALNFFNEKNTIDIYFNIETINNAHHKVTHFFDNAIKSLPASKKGAPEKPHLKKLIQMLIKLYTEGTNQQAKCYWGENTPNEYTQDGDLKGKYVGEFYDFLIFIQPLLEERLKIFMGTPLSLGKSAQETLSEIR